MERSLVAVQLAVAFVGPGLPLVSIGSEGTNDRTLVKGTDTGLCLAEVVETHTGLDHNQEAATVRA